MAEKLELIGKIILDSKQAESSVGVLQTKLEKAKEAQIQFVNQFGEASKEAQEAAQEVAMLEQSILKLKDPVTFFNNELNKTQTELTDVVAKFGEASPEADEVRAKIEMLNGSIEALNDPVQFFTSELDQAKVALQETITKFGEASPEALEAANAVKEIEKNLQEVSDQKPDEPIKSLKAQLRDAKNELNFVVEKFGETSSEAARAAARVAEIEDKIGDAKLLTDAFNPDEKFKALGNSIQGAVGAFTAVTGAQALFGKESENVQKQIAKLQGALALSQGLNQVLASKDAFKALGLQIKESTAFKTLDTAATKTAAAVQTLFTGAVNTSSKAFKGLKVAIAATGIGALVVALGAVVAYWDDIKEAFSGLSSSQAKLNEQGEKNLETQEKKLEAIDGQDQILKQQGKSERDILKLKVAQSAEAIKAAEINLENAKATKKAQVDAAKRNKEFLKGALDFVSIPLTLLLRSIDAIGKALGKDFGLTEGFKESVANLIFDPKEVAAEGDKAITEAQSKLDKLKNQKAGFENQIKGIDDNAAKERQAKSKEAAQKEKELQDKRTEFAKATEELIAQNQIDAIKDAGLKKQQQIEKDYKKEIDLLNAQLQKGEITQELFNQRKSAIDAKFNLQREQTQAEIDAKRAENARQTEELIQQARLEGIKDGFTKQQILLEQEYQDQIDAALKAREDGTLDEEEYQKKRLAIDQLYQQKRTNAIDENNKQNALKEFDRRTKELEDIVASNAETFAAKQQAITDEEKLLEDARAKGLIDTEEYNEKLKKLSNDRVQTEIAEKEARAKIVGEYADIASGLAKVFAGFNEKNKGLQIAAVLVEQAGAVAKIVTNTLAANARAKLELGPVAGTAFSIKNTITAGISVAQAIQAAIKGIKQIKSANAGGSPSGTSGGGNVGATDLNAPLPPQAETTALPQEQINQLSGANAAVRSYVVESDVTSNQERIVRINRAARIN